MLFNFMEENIGFVGDLFRITPLDVFLSIGFHNNEGIVR